MEFDEIVVKESPGLCRCCLSEGCYKDLGSEYAWMNDREVYADMLLECFDISISQQNEGPNGPNRLICEVCITRLRDACNFKKQVVESEKKFVDMIGRGEFRPKVLIYQSDLKAEQITEEPVPDDGEIEYLDEDMDFGDNAEKMESDSHQVTVEDITVSALPMKGKRGRPRKNPETKPEKKPKVAKTEKPRTSKVGKGAPRPEHVTPEAESKSSMTSTKRNRLMKRNAITILESSNLVPFKWHRRDYLCFYCHKPLKTIETLKVHTENDHKRASIKAAVSFLRRDEKVKVDVIDLKCKICDSAVGSLDFLIDHLVQVHGRSFNRECGYGLIPYKLQDEVYECAVCDERFEYFIKLNQHMNEHYSSYICELCGKAFLSHERLRSHSLSHGSGFRCNVCSEAFDSLTQRTAHEARVHNRDRQLKCLYCAESFPNYSQRKRHHSAVHGVDVPEYGCPVCHKKFQIMSKMRVHLKEVHFREKNFSCTICEQKFFSKSHVDKHMVKHCGERVFSCEVCRKSYARKQTLRDHMRIHSDDKRFICAVCSQGFVQNNSLRLHMRVHHPDS